MSDENPFYRPTDPRGELTQHPSLGQVLLSTGGSLLIEHTRTDRSWGDGGDGTSRNRLGLTRLETREELPATETDRREGAGG